MYTQTYFILFYFILFYFILFYFILFYFILFYFILLFYVYMTRLDEKIIDEYVNFMGVVQKLDNIPFINDHKLRRKLFGQLQHLIEDRILYRYKIKSPPYHGYNPIEDDEMGMINDFFTAKKEYMKNKGDINEVYDKIDQMKDFFIDTINNKKKIFANMYTDNNNSIQVTDEFIKYKKVKIPLDDRLRFLLNKMGTKRFVRMILRYVGYGINGQHCSIPTNVYEYMYNAFGVHGEGFSSPLNSKLLELPDTVFCTLFKDTDKYIGSQGPFSHKALVKNSDKNWTVNPPYMTNVMYMVYKEVMKAFKKIKRHDFLVIVLIPKWTDDRAYIKFTKCKYLVKLVEPQEGKHYMNCNGRSVYMNGVINSAFFLCRNSNVVTDDKINKLLELWNINVDSTINQSSFAYPERVAFGEFV
jgi:hypothetical protein